jgi:hypothetical protein
MRSVAIDLQRFVRRPYTLLALSLATLLFLWPIVLARGGGEIAGRILFAVVLLAGAYANSEKRHRLILVIVLGLPAFALNWFEAIAPGRFNLAELIFSTIFLTYTTYTVLDHILRTTRVTTDTISGGIAVYLLIAILFALLFTIFETMMPGSFRLPDDVALSGNLHLSQSEGSVFLYLSMVTLTTLGYGDIVPLTAPSRALVGMEATIGQLYLTILVARLVGLHVTSRRD